MSKKYLKDHIANVFKELSRTKPIQKITINDIVAECEISKQTFYNNFQDKNDLLRYIVEEYGIHNLKRAVNSGLDYTAAIKNYYENALSLTHFFRSFMYDKELQLMLLNMIEQTSIDYMHTQIEHYFGKSELTPEVELAILFNGAGNAKLFVDWMVNGMKISPELMAEANFACIPEILKSYFNCSKIARIPSLQR